MTRLKRRKKEQPVTCRHCGGRIYDCYAVTVWGHRHAANCKGWTHDGDVHECPGSTVAEPAGEARDAS